MQILNLAILRHPMNWLLVFVVLMIWIFFFDLLHAYITGRDPAQPAQSAA